MKKNLILCILICSTHICKSMLDATTQTDITYADNRTNSIPTEAEQTQKTDSITTVETLEQQLAQATTRRNIWRATAITLMIKSTLTTTCTLCGACYYLYQNYPQNVDHFITTLKSYFG